jgi:hypothetical protein
MYFGALMIGAESAAGILAFILATEKKMSLSLAFKSVNANFIKRPTSAVTFKNTHGALIESMLDSSAASGERVNKAITVEAFDKEGVLVAEFSLELSLKVVPKK